MSEIKIFEGQGGDISTVYAARVDTSECYPNGQNIKVDMFSCFNGTYQVHKEREFIAKIDAENPGRWSSYTISWSDCN